MERGGLYCSFFHNSLVFYHFIHKTRIFCRLRPSLSSLIRLSNALRSLLWTSKVPKKSNMSNKPGAPCRTKFFGARQETAYSTPCRFDPRSSEVRAACADAGFEKLECHRTPDGKTRRACHAPDDASQGEPHHRVGLNAGLSDSVWQQNSSSPR